MVHLPGASSPRRAGVARGAGGGAHLAGLEEEEAQRLMELARHFLSRKTLTQIGVELTPRQQGVLALQAVLPVLHLGFDWYRGFHEVIIIPEPVTRRPGGAGRVRAGERI